MRCSELLRFRSCCFGLPNRTERHWGREMGTFGWWEKLLELLGLRPAPIPFPVKVRRTGR